ncbi:glycosyltransferase family 39 protein [Patescibacteria group bacterium]|nr:glycosyltransferase family 39 protein [Patescibacteria group bacterium]
MNTIQKYRSLGTTFYWLSILLLLLIFHTNHPIIDSDEGVTLNGAWNLWNNKALYIDFFEFVPPGSLYLIFLIWKIFNSATYLLANLFAILCIFLSTVGIFKISALLHKTNYNYFSPFIFGLSSLYWPIINHNIFSLVPTIWATYYLAKGLKNNKLKYFAASGLLTGASMLILQQKGIALFIVVLSTLVFLYFKEKQNHWAKATSVYVAASLIPVILLFFKWSPILLYNNLIVFPLLNYRETNKLPLTLLLFFVIIAIFAFYILRKRNNRLSYTLFAIQFGLLATTLARPGHLHISLAIFPLYVLAPSIIKEINSFRSRIKKTAYGVAIVIIFIITFPALQSLQFNPPFSSANTDTLDFIKENCLSQYDLYVGPFLPGYYFETSKLNVTPFSFIITNMHTEKDFELASVLIKQKEPKCAVLNYAMVNKFKYNQDNPIDNYIFSNYDEVKRFNDTIMFIRNEKN